MTKGRLKMHVNADRMHASLAEFAGIGGTPGGGVTRLAASDEDRAARDLLAERMRQAGLDVRTDDLGNMTGRRRGIESGPAVVLGSHLDTVQLGGKYDGAFGVLSALEVVQVLNDAAAHTVYPVEVVNWTDEEGARFSPANTGSGTIAGQFDRQFVYDRTDNEGRRFEDELLRIGYLGTEDNRPGPARAYLEAHVEQGPLLEEAGLAVGVVDGVVGMTWLDVTVTGAANHVGTTPMDRRKDALAAVSEIVLEVERLGRETQGAVTAVGRLQVEPNLPGVVAGRAMCTVSLCHREASTLEGLVDALTNKAEFTVTERGVDIAINRIWNSPPAPFQSEVTSAIELTCTELGIRTTRLWAGAGHDAMYTQKIWPTGMVVVRSAGGLSHCEAEYSTPEDLEVGANVLLHTALRFARLAR
jgi:beta-ureidopropionase / N-carbamoyl-L-amino-acid hydrolase